ncbi:MAG: prepilin-type N-terminal cleavage/methylation domain-containing protein [bacterium]
MKDKTERGIRPFGFRIPTFGFGRQGGRAGLTLIEVMLAMVILGIALAVLVSTAGTCLSIAKKARNYETARELLARLELEHPIKKDKIEDAKGSGSFDSEFSGYRWERDVECVGLEKDGLWKITSTVRWSESSGQSAEELVTYVHAPQDDIEESF